MGGGAGCRGENGAEGAIGADALLNRPNAGRACDLAPGAVAERPAQPPLSFAICGASTVAMQLGQIPWLNWDPVCRAM